MIEFDKLGAYKKTLKDIKNFCHKEVENISNFERKLHQANDVDQDEPKKIKAELNEVINCCNRSLNSINSIRAIEDHTKVLDTCLEMAVQNIQKNPIFKKKYSILSTLTAKLKSFITRGRVKESPIYCGRVKSTATFFQAKIGNTDKESAAESIIRAFANLGSSALR